MYCIHMVEGTPPGIPSFLIPENRNDKMQFIQEVCHVTRCEVLVYCRLENQEGDIALSIPLGYYRHSGNRHVTHGQWMYKLQFWRGY